MEIDLNSIKNAWNNITIENLPYQKPINATEELKVNSMIEIRGNIIGLPVDGGEIFNLNLRHGAFIKHNKSFFLLLKNDIYLETLSW